MKEASQKFQQQTRSMFTERPNSGTYGSVSRSTTRGNEIPRAASPAPPRSASPRPGSRADMQYQHRSASPNPYSGSQSQHQRGTSGSQSQSQSQHQRGSSAQVNPKRGSDQGYYRQNSPNEFARSGSSMGGRAPSMPGREAAWAGAHRSTPDLEAAWGGEELRSLPGPVAAWGM